MRDILLKEIMTKPAVTVNVTDRFSAVERRMREKKVRHIPVVDRDQHVV
ncbi:MAG: CBS domain-containing protein, partial [Candidatus Omnitrophica bacterium]|nr:CBS domain-containing protein [Candidatus Omnitrophota bacterium]